MPLTAQATSYLHNMGEKLKNGKSLSKEDRSFLSSIATPDEIDKAINILLKHDPITQLERAEAKTEEIAMWRCLSENAKKVITDNRIAGAQERRKARIAQEAEYKQIITDELNQLLRDVKAKGFSPMFTHYRDEYVEGRLGATTCVILDSNVDPVAKGVALVSMDDNGSRLTGRLLSLQRAWVAYMAQKNFDKIKRWEAYEIIDCLEEDIGSQTYKGLYKPKALSNIETERLIRRKSRKV